MRKGTYLRHVCYVNECSEQEYVDCMESNFVIIEESGKPLCWHKTEFPIIYGDNDCDGDICEGDKVITEREFFDKYLTD